MFWQIEGYPLQFFLEHRETDPSPDAALPTDYVFTQVLDTEDESKLFSLHHSMHNSGKAIRQGQFPNDQISHCCDAFTSVAILIITKTQVCFKRRET